MAKKKTTKTNKQTNKQQKTIPACATPGYLYGILDHSYMASTWLWDHEERYIIYYLHAGKLQLLEKVPLHNLS